MASMLVFSSMEDKTGNATFSVGIFEETHEAPLRAVSLMSCSDTKKCLFFKPLYLLNY